MPLMIARRPTRNPGGLNIAATMRSSASHAIPSLSSVSRGGMASVEEEAAAAPPKEESAGMKQFHINEQKRQEMEHGQSAPLAGPQPGSCASSGCTFQLSG